MLKNNLSAFITVGVNNTSNKKNDYFDYLASNPAGKSPWVSFHRLPGLKAVLIINIDSQNNFFVNIGTVEKTTAYCHHFP